MLTFSRSQFSQFQEIARSEWVGTASRALYDSYPQHYDRLRTLHTDLVPVVDAVARWAQYHNMSSKADATRLVHVAAVLGHKFWKDPRFARFINPILESSIPASRQSMAITKEAKSWLRLIWADDSLPQFGRRLADAIVSDANPNTQILRRILPGHWIGLDNSQNTEFLNWLETIIPVEFEKSRAQNLAFMACALVHGTGWATDPQCGELRRIIGTDQTVQNFANSVDAFYRKDEN